MFNIGDFVIVKTQLTRVNTLGKPRLYARKGTRGVITDIFLSPANERYNNYPYKVGYAKVKVANTITGRIEILTFRLSSLVLNEDVTHIDRLNEARPEGQMHL